MVLHLTNLQPSEHLVLMAYAEDKGRDPLVIKHGQRTVSNSMCYVLWRYLWIISPLNKWNSHCQSKLPAGITNNHNIDMANLSYPVLVAKQQFMKICHLPSPSLLVLFIPDFWRTTWTSPVGPLHGFAPPHLLLKALLGSSVGLFDWFLLQDMGFRIQIWGAAFDLLQTNKIKSWKLWDKRPRAKSSGKMETVANIMA